MHSRSPYVITTLAANLRRVKRLITRITGKLLAVHEGTALLEVPPFEYEIQIPEFNRRQLQTQVGAEVSLHTLHYLDGNPAHGRLTPRLIGFLSQVEREFFEMFCSVDGVGMRKALRAMVKPVQDVAVVIEEQDAKALSTLPGVGAATAERIIAKLRRKMPRFALLVGMDGPPGEEGQRDVVSDTFQALCSLGHSEAESHKLIDTVLETKKKFKDVNAMLTAIYETSHHKE